ncbi:MAG: FHA domain-containing protein [Kiritimatiellae bacterium]|nr:FHA domain-containing protein [Kiritimatiellia bacterium]
MKLTTLFMGRRESRELTDGAYIIGRGETCRIRFDSPEVSERHAVLTVRDGRALLEDLHSAGGTAVNGEAIDSAVALDSGMVVQIGDAMLRVSDGDDGEGGGADYGSPPP